MVLYAWYPTIWYQAYGTMYQQGTYFRSFVRTYVQAYMDTYVRTYENTKNKILEYVPGKYRIVWYHIKKNRYYFVCTVLSCTGTISKKVIDIFLKS